MEMGRCRGHLTKSSMAEAVAGGIEPTMPKSMKATRPSLVRARVRVRVRVRVS